MNATGFLVGAGTPDDAMMAGIRDLGFAALLPYAGMEAVERQTQQTPICYFLFSTVPDVMSLQATADTIRFSASRKLRFSPMIYFAPNPSTETIMACINMGFDDIITQPFTRRRIAERIARQVGHSFTYYETSAYFGPDRRDRVPGPARVADVRNGGQFRRLEIVRNLISGINVLQDDLFTPI
jgi:DNA-binding response OmpR family regulator